MIQLNRRLKLTLLTAILLANRSPLADRVARLVAASHLVDLIEQTVPDQVAIVGVGQENVREIATLIHLQLQASTTAPGEAEPSVATTENMIVLLRHRVHGQCGTIDGTWNGHQHGPLCPKGTGPHDQANAHHHRHQYDQVHVRGKVGWPK